MESREPGGNHKSPCRPEESEPKIELEPSEKFVVAGLTDKGLVKENNEDYYLTPEKFGLLSQETKQVLSEQDRPKAEKDLYSTVIKYVLADCARSKVAEIRQIDQGTVEELVAEITSQDCPAVVADGMGGHENGEVASRVASEVFMVEYLRQRLAEEINGPYNSATRVSDSRRIPGTAEETAPKKPRREVILEASLKAANKAVWDYNLKQPLAIFEGRAGTTFIAAVFDGDQVYIVNIGDTRAYLLSDNQLQLITRDQSQVMKNEQNPGLVKTAAKLLLANDAEQAIYRHPNRHIILNSLGDTDPDDFNRRLERLNKKDNLPSFYRQKIKIGDKILLCSDGLWEMLRDKKEAAMKLLPELTQAASYLYHGLYHDIPAAASSHVRGLLDGAIPLRLSAIMNLQAEEISIEDLMRSEAVPKTILKRMIENANLVGGLDNHTGVIIEKK